MGEKITFRKMIQDPGFARLFSAGVISRFGDSVDAIAYSYMVYAMTGSAVLMATLFAVNGIPSLIFNMISGVLVGYFPKKRVVYLCDFGRGLVVTLTAVLYFIGALEVWHLYLFTIMNSTFEAFRAPAGSMLYKLLISEEKMDHAISLDTSARTFAELIGYSIAAFLIGVIGVSGAILLDGVTFLLSGLIISTLPKVQETLVKEKLTLASYFENLKEGFKYVIKNPLIRSLVVFLGGIAFFFSPFNALQTPYVLDTLDLGPSGIAVLSISFMAAMIVGSLLVPSISKKIGYRWMFIIGGMVVGIGYALFGTIEVFSGTFAGFIALGAVSIVMGSTVSFMNVPLRVTFMKKVAVDKLARASALMSVLALSASPIGGALSGAVVSFMSISKLFYLSGGIIILLFFSQIFNPSLKQMDEKGTIEGVGNELEDEAEQMALESSLD